MTSRPKGEGCQEFSDDRNIEPQIETLDDSGIHKICSKLRDGQFLTTPIVN